MSESLSVKLEPILRSAREAASKHRARYPGRVLIFRWDSEFYSVHGEDVSLFLSLFGPGLTPEPNGEDLLFREDDPDSLFRRIAECGLDSVILDRQPCPHCGKERIASHPVRVELNNE